MEMQIKVKLLYSWELLNKEGFRLNTREVGRTVTYQKYVEIQEVGVVEKLAYINHNIESKQMIVGTKLFNSKDEVIQEDQIIIENDKYEELMQGDDAKNSYSTDMVWVMIDRLRGN